MVDFVRSQKCGEAGKMALSEFLILGPSVRIRWVTLAFVSLLNREIKNESSLSFRQSDQCLKPIPADRFRPPLNPVGFYLLDIQLQPFAIVIFMDCLL